MLLNNLARTLSDLNRLPGSHPSRRSADGAERLGGTAGASVGAVAAAAVDVQRRAGRGRGGCGDQSTHRHQEACHERRASHTPESLNYGSPYRWNRPRCAGATGIPRSPSPPRTPAAGTRSPAVWRCYRWTENMTSRRGHIPSQNPQRILLPYGRAAPAPYRPLTVRRPNARSAGAGKPTGSPACGWRRRACGRCWTGGT